MVKDPEKQIPGDDDTRLKFKSAAFKKYFANTSWLLAEKIAKIIISAVVGIYVIRYLGPERYGLLRYAISFVALFTAVSALGLDRIIVRELLKTPDKRDEILGTGFLMKFIGAVVTIILIAAGMFFIEDSEYTAMLVIIVSVQTLFQSMQIVDFFFQAEVKAKYIAIVQTTAIVISSVLKVIFILLELPLVYFVIVASAEWLFIAVGFATAYKIYGFKLTDWSFRFKTARNFLKDSWPLILSTLAVTIYMRIGQVLIKQMLGDKEAGYYGSAAFLSEAWYFIPMVISNSLFPAIMNAKKKSKELYRNRLQKFYDLMVVLSVGIAVPIAFFSEEIITIFLGVEYLSATGVLTLYIWSCVPVFLASASSQYLIAENFTRLAFYRTLSGGVVNIGLNLWLIPEMGIEGSALASLLSYFFTIFIMAASPKIRHQVIMILKSLLFINITIEAARRLRSFINR